MQKVSLLLKPFSPSLAQSPEAETLRGRINPNLIYISHIRFNALMYFG